MLADLRDAMDQIDAAIGCKAQPPSASMAANACACINRRGSAGCDLRVPALALFLIVDVISGDREKQVELLPAAIAAEFQSHLVAQ